MRCMGYCPSKAVEAGQSWMVALYFITSVPAGAYFFSWLTTQYPGKAGLENWFSIQLVNLLYLYASLFLSYFIFHWLIRIRRVNALFTYTTFTHIYLRYHEPKTRLKDFGHQHEPRSRRQEDVSCPVTGDTKDSESGGQPGCSTSTPSSRSSGCCRP